MEGTYACYVSFDQGPSSQPDKAQGSAFVWGCGGCTVEMGLLASVPAEVPKINAHDCRPKKSLRQKPAALVSPGPKAFSWCSTLPISRAGSRFRPRFSLAWPHGPAASVSQPQDSLGGDSKTLMIVQCSPARLRSSSRDSGGFDCGECGDQGPQKASEGAVPQNQALRG